MTHDFEKTLKEMDAFVWRHIEITCIDPDLAKGFIVNHLGTIQAALKMAIDNQPKQSSNEERLKKIRELGLPDSALKLVEDDYDKFLAFAETLRSPAFDQPKPIHHNGKDYWPDKNGWYDIETAPKDGTHCLIAIEGLSRAFLGVYNGESWNTIHAGNDWSGRKVIAWKPMPQPPESEDA